MLVSDIRRTEPEKIRMLIDRSQYAGQHQQELNILMWCLARIHQIDAIIRYERPVVVLTGAIDTGERFLMKQALETMAWCGLLHDLHHQLVMVDRKVRLIIDRCQLMLCRCDLVMLGLRGDTELPELYIHIAHEGSDAMTDGTEIVIIELLALRRHDAEEGTPRIDEVLPLQILVPVDQEVLLLCTDGWLHRLRCRVTEQTENTQCLFIDRLHGSKQRGLRIQCLTTEGTEGGRNAKCYDFAMLALATKEGRAGAVPDGVASRLKGRTKSTGRKRRSIGLTADQLLAGELHDDLTVGIGGRDKGIMLLCGDSGQRLEPVRVVGRTVLECPLLHRLCNRIRDGRIELVALCDGLLQLLIDCLRKTLLHHLVVKDILTENFRNI